MRRSVSLDAVALSLILLAACQVGGESLTAGDEPIVNGSLDFADPAVVFLSFSSGGGGWSCSGTLISPHVVLTAEHCVNGASGGSAFFGHDPGGAGTWVKIVHMRAHPSSDIGMVALEKVGPATPIPFNGANLASYVGQAVRIVGFGATSEDGPGGLKRQGKTKLNSLDGDSALIGFDNQSATCYGDSGGPYFMTIGGQERVVAVTSWGVAPCGTPPQGGTRADLVAAWIQQYVNERDGGGEEPTYRLVARHSNKCLDVNAASSADGAKIQQWGCNGTGAQSFKRESLGGGWYRFRNTNSNKCVDIPGASTGNGVAYQLYTCNGTGAQSFRLDDRGGGYFRLRNQTSNKCADIAGAGQTDGTAVLQWPCSDTAQHQQWRFEQL